MKKRADQVFLEALGRWVDGWKARADYQHSTGDRDSVLAMLQKTFTRDVMRRIGAGYIRGLLEDGGPHHVRLPKLARDQACSMVTNSGGEVIPCKEVFLQLSEYVSLETMAAGCEGVVIGFEREFGDRRTGQAMDLTVEFDDRLLAYVEVKTDVKAATKLIEQITAAMKAPVQRRLEKNEPAYRELNDGEKKLNYLLAAGERGALRACNGFEEGEMLLVVRACGGDAEPIFERRMMVSIHPDTQLVRVRDGGERDFMPLDEPVAIWLEKVLSRDVAVQADLAWRLERKFPQLWLGRGTKDRSFNLYLGTETGDHILLGLMADGRVYSEPAALGEGGKARLAAELLKSGLSLGDGDKWTYWRTESGQPLRLDQEPGVANQILERIAPALLLYDTPGAE